MRTRRELTGLRAVENDLSLGSDYPDRRKLQRTEEARLRSMWPRCGGVADTRNLSTLATIAPSSYYEIINPLWCSASLLAASIVMTRH